MENRKVKKMIESITGGRYTTLYNLDTGKGDHVALVFWGGEGRFNGKVSLTANQLNKIGV
ncbi:hypothetical protein NVP1137O_16 [Vibrio phage 1.137.O._10N.261.46.B5]|nr:hypothetical protein NVP1137O_16 [Vibrio phage 1.137.O._10N.261.46.B5]